MRKLRKLFLAPFVGLGVLLAGAVLFILLGFAWLEDKLTSNEDKYYETWEKKE